MCTKLTNLTLYGNPICVKPSADGNEHVDPSYSYRHEIIRLLPDLQVLDDELTLNTSIAPVMINKKAVLNTSKRVNYEAVPSTHHECPFDDDWQLINQFIEEGIGPTEDKLAINGI